MKLGDVYSWYDTVEDAANSIRYSSSKGVCAENGAVVEFIKAMLSSKKN